MQTDLIENDLNGELPIHPAAQKLPMLSSDALDALADDIRENEQRDEIVVLVDDAGKRWLLDGRNRREACKLAGVKPRYREVTLAQIGNDPAAYVLSVNVMRRDLAQSQKAMAVAFQYPEGEPGRYSASGLTRNKLGVNSEYVRQARIVLKHSHLLAERVLKGELPLGQAYQSVAGTAPIGSPGPAPAPTASSTLRFTAQEHAHARRWSAQISAAAV